MPFITRLCTFLKGTASGSKLKRRAPTKAEQGTDTATSWATQAEENRTLRERNEEKDAQVEKLTTELEEIKKQNEELKNQHKKIEKTLKDAEQENLGLKRRLVIVNLRRLDEEYSVTGDEER